MQLLHGSGKTAVLVERIINKVINEKIDIDKILIVTFTNAAASEMRERILNAIYKKIDENPNDIHLQKQITLLNKANICTIHSFCLDVIRNYFYEIDTSANFQIADTAELELLKQEILDDLFEQKYIDKDKEFLKLIDVYATYRGDEPLKELVLKIYNQIQSNPFPKQWLEEKVELFNLESKLDDDFSKTIWGEILLNELEKEFIESRIKLEKVRNKLNLYPELDKFSTTISTDIIQIENIEKKIQSKSDNLWEDIYNLAENLKFEKWPIDKKVTIQYKEEAKQIRDKVKKSINQVIEKTLIYTSKEANIDINSMYSILVSLKNLVLEFEEKFSQSKKEKNKIDFHDIEHFALKILVNNNNGKIERTEIAKQIENKFVEIDIDEYQDSNLVQEYILKSISNGKNIFMVGDVKQSIYRFRQARPELFLEKYSKYNIVDNKDDIKNIENENINGRKVKLFKNFRSRKEVLDFTNIVFKNIMSKELGDIDYLEDEYLNLGADYPESVNNSDIPELHIIDLKQEENIEDEEDNNLENIIEKNVTEAQFVANKIEELIKNNFMIYDRKIGYRKVEYKDIVILLRTTSNIAPIYEKELINKNIPVFCDTSAEYLDSTEIQTILSLLKIIDNPLQDIPLITVLRSTIGNFTDNELVEIRLKDNSNYFYQSMEKGIVSLNEDLKNKIIIFFENLKKWRQQEKQKSLDELIWQIYIDTNYYNYVGLLSNGNLRQANLKMLFDKAKQYESASFKGLYNFINFIDKLKTSSGDLSAAKIIGENDNVVRIMSIHKSKGLEFPIVLLSGTGKQFNKQDLNQSVLIHQDIGFGPKYINTTRNIEYQTLAKEAIKIKLEKEMISEEMRVLYVALTRAKEKLIITGTINDLGKLMKEQEETINIYEQQDKEKINERILQKYSSYLEWFTLISLKEKQNIENKLILKIYNINDVKNNEKKEEKIENKIEELEKIEVDKLQIEEIREKLNWEYYFKKSLNIPTKTSVTNIKEEKQNQDILLDNIINVKYSSNLTEPNFTKEEKISPMRKGSLIHLCIQRLDINEDYTHNKLIEFVENLVNKNFITIEESKSINISVLDKYINSNLWKELKNAKEIHREEPFYIQIPASDIYLDNKINEKILVQGIIDLYYIDKDNNLILVDYKTDYVEDKNILKEKYKEQLKIYKQALEQALNRKVSKVIIYSTYFGEIEINE